MWWLHLCTFHSVTDRQTEKTTSFKLREQFFVKLPTFHNPKFDTFFTAAAWSTIVIMTQEEDQIPLEEPSARFQTLRRRWYMLIVCGLMGSLQVCKFVQRSQCGNFRIFMSLRFYVKSILENVEVEKLTSLPFYWLWILLIWWNLAFRKCNKK